MTRVALSGTELPNPEAEQSVHRICDDPALTWEQWWVRASERVNPILVKEVRQSLKSQQFVLGFSLTLIAAVAWTIIAISLLVPRIYYVPGGLPLLIGYFVILHIPLMIIIPFSAYRSLTAETEDSTYELLSITTLSAQQIIRGKLVTSLLQVLIYLSAMMPCVVMTYLLRGISLFTILFVLFWTIIFSVSLISIALLLASVSRSRLIHSSVSVLLLIGLLAATFGWTIAVVQPDFMVSLDSAPTEMPLVFFGMATFVVAAISLVLRAASAAIDFPSENSATPIRWRFLLVTVVGSFWISMICGATNIVVPWLPALILLAIVYALVGALICGEIGVISPRAQRQLPQTLFSRALLTWFNPGSGTGYVFVIVSFASLVMLVGLQELYLSMQPNFSRQGLNHSVALFGYVLLCYLTSYLGVTRLIMLKLGKMVPARMIASVAITVVLLILGSLLPLIVVFTLNDYNEFSYAAHQFSNFFWTLIELADGNNRSELAISVLLLTLASMAIFVLNLFTLSRELMVVRIEAPLRVQDETKKPVAPAIAIDPFKD